MIISFVYYVVMRVVPLDRNGNSVALFATHVALAPVENAIG
jgi:hypothetical protein